MFPPTYFHWCGCVHIG